MNTTIRRAARHGAAVLALGAGAVALAGAQPVRIFTAGPTGDVWRADADTGSFSYFGCTCNGPIVSLAIQGEHVYAGDIFGSIIRFDLHTGGLTGFIFSPGDARAIVVHNEQLLVADSTGVIRRMDPQTGQVLGSFTAPIAINTMLLDGESLYVAGPSGDVWRGDATTGDFQYFACACLPNVTGLTRDGGHIVAASEAGNVMSFDIGSGAITDFFTIPADVTAIAMHDGDLLLSSADGMITRVDPESGALRGSLAAPRAVDALIVHDPGSLEVADLNGDGVVNVGDIGLMLGQWGVCPEGCLADLNGDSVVNSFDLAIVLGSWS